LKIRLRSARLVLADYGDEDLPRLTRLLGDPVTMAHWPAPLDARASQAWFERARAAYGTPGFGRFAIWQGAVYIGDAGILRAEVNGWLENDLGYIVDHAHWGHGYGLEAARALLEEGRRCGLGRIVANMAASNVASVRVAERLGMKLETRFLNPRNRNLETLLYCAVPGVDFVDIGR
jgi:RimJ/RimL family protein N-acetyltransferase